MTNELVGITIEEIHQAADAVGDSVFRTIEESDADVVCKRCGEEMQWGREYQLDSENYQDALCPDCYHTQDSAAENGVADRDAFRADVLAAVEEIQEQNSALLAYADRHDHETLYIEETDEYRVLAGEVVEAYASGMFDNAVEEAVMRAFDAAGKRLAGDTEQELQYFVLPPLERNL